MNKKRHIRVIVAKPGLDGHDRGAKVLTLGLRDEGFEVIYTGLRQTPEMIAEITMQEQADVVAMSCLSGAHNSLFPATVKELKNKGMDDVLVLGGGNIPPEDIPGLLKGGIDAVFGQGVMIRDIANYIREKLQKN
jgi:methylmalonyl-CoA mutase, C-terminal domain